MKIIKKDCCFYKKHFGKVFAIMLRGCEGEIHDGGCDYLVFVGSELLMSTTELPDALKSLAKAIEYHVSMLPAQSRVERPKRYLRAHKGA